MNLRAVLAVAAALCAATATTTARAWQEAHQSGEDVRVHVEADGLASVEDLVKWRVVHGPVKSIDLVNVDPTATLKPDVTITGEDGHALTGHLVRADERTVRVLVDQPRALMHGIFTFDIGWRVDLVATHALSYDGASWRLAWSAPVASDGLDASRTVFDLPAAPEEPRPILADTGAVDDTAVATVERAGGRDALELVRPHVARGESASWTVRVDPRALSRVTDPTLRPARVAPPPEPDRVRAVSLTLLLGVLALAFGALVAHKTSAFAAACAARGARPCGLIPLPAAARALFAAAAFAGAVACQIGDRPFESALLAGAAALFAALRAPRVRASVRGPGKWLALRPEEAFAALPAPRHWMDAGGPAGRASMILLLALACVAAVVARGFAPEGPWLVAIDALALVPLFATGRAVQMPPVGEGSAAPWLQRTFDRLRQVPPLRAVPWARVTLDGSTIDELRLLVLPRAAIAGIAGIEVGLGWVSTPVGWVGAPEVLVRVLDGSPAAARLAQSGSVGRVLPGRRPDERVLRAVPRVRTPAGAASLAGAFAEVMTDRRSRSPSGVWTAPERRIFVSASASASASAAKAGPAARAHAA
jgi:hypothetical protein